MALFPSGTSRRQWEEIEPGTEHTEWAFAAELVRLLRHGYPGVGPDGPIVIGNAPPEQVTPSQGR